jgi:DNA-binding transcriptional MocR family regulator
MEAFSDPWDKGEDSVEERQGIIVEEFAYMAAVQTSAPRGIQVVPVSVDSQGLNPSGPEGLEAVLKNWDPRNGRRPHMMYTVTVGHNPTGGTLSVERRKEIYKLCHKYDVGPPSNKPLRVTDMSTR